LAQRIRLLTQTAFLGLSLCVFSGWATDRHVVAFYHGLHVFPTMASLPWFMLPPLGRFSLAVAALLFLVSLAAGRIYCSFLCPVGFLQELSRRLGRALGLSGRPTTGWTPVRCLILVMSLAFVALRSSAYLYFDHFSNLGRVYGLAHALRTGGPFEVNFFLGLVFLAVLVFPPLRWPRWFCGALCPSGTLFMLLQKIAPGKVRSHGCGGECRQCSSVCPARCISDGRIDGKLCINCLECVDACAKNAMAFTFRRPWATVPAEMAVAPGSALSRRELLAAAGFSLAAVASAPWARKRLLGAGSAAAVIPPGGKAYETFLERCVACDTCVSVCPSRVLVPAGRELGLGGLAKIRLDYGVSYCAYECNACLAVCPSGAISYFPLEAKKRIRIGKSRLIKELCIPYAFERDCGACQEQCPTGAITMEPFRSVYAPVQHEDTCIGCGACQFACPTRPRKAIVVDALETHAFASAPRPASPHDCRDCAGRANGQACWRCRRGSPEREPFPF